MGSATCIHLFSPCIIYDEFVTLTEVENVCAAHRPVTWPIIAWLNIFLGITQPVTDGAGE